MSLSLVRKLRHGPLAFLAPFWVALGKVYRKVVVRIPGLSVRQKIGGYGPFKMLPIFAFSDFENWGGGHNKGFRACVEACRGKQCVFDVGAHVGLVSLPVASVLAPEGRLYSFEPADANVSMLRRHLRMNGMDNVQVVQSIVGDAHGAQHRFFESEGHHGQNAVILKNQEVLKSEQGGYFESQRPVVSIDGFAGENGLKPDIIKIDVEGGELEVLKGAATVLKQCKPLIFLSVHPAEISMVGHSIQDLKVLIASLGYDITTIDGDPVEEFASDEYLMRPKSTSQPIEKTKK